MTLILNQIFTQSKSGIVTIQVPADTEALKNSDALKGKGLNAGRGTIEGCLVNDRSVSVRNQWGSIMPDVSDLNEFLMVAGQQNLFSWVSASAAAWKSCEPISIALDFYLLSLNRNSHVKSDASALLSLAAMSAGSGGVLDAAKVQIHGGYKMDIWEGNATAAQNNIATYLSGAAQKLTVHDAPGTCIINIGNQLTMKNMLLEEASAEHSAVQVAYGEPLYIKIHAVFRLFRAPLVSDINGMYLSR